VLDTGPSKLGLELAQFLLSRNDEADCVGAGWQVAGATFSRGMYNLGGLKAARQVRSHDDVVVERGGLEGDGVIGSSSWRGSVRPLL
jgi:hypothetical protein